MSRFNSFPRKSNYFSAFLFSVLFLKDAFTNANDNYQCDSDDCGSGQYECMCAQGVPPGELESDQTPQFIVITNDDAITTVTEAAIRQITNPHKNRNGCGIPVTWFAQVDYTDPSLVRELYIDGHEIATHTMSHVSEPSVEEVVGARDWLSSKTGIPIDDINGFRSPYLKHDNFTRGILYDNCFRYDSSITELYGGYNAQTSISSEERLWPYTMDSGIPQDCSVGTGICYDGERWPGLWEIPMWVLQDDNDRAVAAMDPYSSTDSVYTIYNREFERNYNSNRAPVGIFIHAAWLLRDSNNVIGINTFLQEVLQYDDVFVVTVNQLLDWMRDPVDVDTFREKFTRDIQCPERRLNSFSFASVAWWSFGGNHGTNEDNSPNAFCHVAREGHSPSGGAIDCSNEGSEADCDGNSSDGNGNEGQEELLNGDDPVYGEYSDLDGSSYAPYYKKSRAHTIWALVVGVLLGTALALTITFKKNIRRFVRSKLGEREEEQDGESGNAYVGV